MDSDLPRDGRIAIICLLVGAAIIILMHFGAFDGARDAKEYRPGLLDAIQAGGR